MPNNKNIQKPAVINNGILTDALRRASEKAKAEIKKKQLAEQQSAKKTSNKK